MSDCPGSTEAGCRCVDHDPGLMAYATDPVAYERVLAAARRRALRVVTPELTSPASAAAFDGAIPFEKPCDGSMTCSCIKCEADLANRVGKPRGECRQPWEPRMVRRIAA